MRPRLLDLFCGAGGCSVGYHRAGFDVIGVDIEPHPDYPYELEVADAFEALADIDYLSGFDVVHASPPCQGYTTMSNRHRGNGGAADGWQRQITQTIDALRHWHSEYDYGGTWVVENVPGARSVMPDAIALHGGMFRLGVHRPRLFASNAYLMAAPAPPPINPVGVYGRMPDGRRLFTRTDGSSQYAARGLEEGRLWASIG